MLNRRAKYPEYTGPNFKPTLCQLDFYISLLFCGDNFLTQLGTKIPSEHAFVSINSLSHSEPNTALIYVWTLSSPCLGSHYISCPPMCCLLHRGWDPRAGLPSSPSGDILTFTGLYAPLLAITVPCTLLSLPCSARPNGFGWKLFKGRKGEHVKRNKKT